MSGGISVEEVAAVATSSVASPQPAEVSGERQGSPGWTLLVVCVAVFMLVLDMTVVAVALSNIQRDLGGDLGSLQWVIDAYTLTLAGLLLTTATLGDRRGRRLVFAGGLVVFTLASAGCAAAWSPLSLNLIRAVQGIGGALLFGTAMPLVGAAFPTPAGRARAIGAAGASVTAATALGPLVGGTLVNLGGWRWIFLINVPIGALMLLLTRRMIESRSSIVRSADWPGSLLLTGSLLTGLLGLIRGNDDGWASHRVTFLLLTAVFLLLAFISRERWAGEPLLDLGLFAVPRFTGLGIASFFSSATLIASSTYLTLYLANVLGYTPLVTGLRMLPLTVPALIAAPTAAALMRRLPLWLLVAVAVALSGIGLLLASQVKADSDWTVFIPGFVVGGLGLGMIGAVLPGGALTTVDADRYGMAVGAVNTLRHIGIAAGVAGVGAVYQRTATTRATALLGAAPLPEEAHRSLVDAVGSGAGVRVADMVPQPLRETVAVVGRTASADSLSRVLFLAGVVAVVSAVICAPLIAPEPRFACRASGQTPTVIGFGVQPESSTSARTEAENAATASSEPPSSAKPPGGPTVEAENPSSALAVGATAASPLAEKGTVDGPGAPIIRDEPDDLHPEHRTRSTERRTGMNRQEKLGQIIGDVRRAIPELTGVMIASADGLPIMHDFPDSVAERVAAMAVTASGVGLKLAERTELGALEESIVRGSSGYLLAYPVGEEGVLVISGPKGCNLGLIRLEARTASRWISELLR